MSNQSPTATKADLDVLASKLRGEIGDLRKEITSFKDEVKLYFDVVAEQLTNNFRGIFNDRTVDLTNARKDHERRIERLEARVGIFS